jgi:hypothetical protein
VQLAAIATDIRAVTANWTAPFVPATPRTSKPREPSNPKSGPAVTEFDVESDVFAIVHLL